MNKHDNAYLADILFNGFFSSNLRRKNLPDDEIFNSSYSISFSQISFIVVWQDTLLNGKLPTNNSYIITPMLHTSTASLYSPLNVSGAR